MNAPSILRSARSLLKLASLAALALPATACMMDAEEPGDLDADVAVEAEVFTRTIVTLHDDGTETIELRDVTLEEQLGDQHLRQLRLGGQHDGLGTTSDAITKDSGCAGSAIWIFDQVNLTGNEICFVGGGVVDLNNYCRTSSNNLCFDRWSYDVRSYWAGVDMGLFSIGSGFTCGSGQGTCSNFTQYEKVTTADSCEQQARFLGLQMLCVPA